MIKSSVVITALTVLLVPASVYAGRTNNRLLSAVEHSDAARVEKLLKREGIFDEKYKKKLLKVAQESVEESEKWASLLKSKWEITEYVLGAGIATAGIINTNSMLKIAGVLTGAYLLLKPYQRHTATRRLENAEDIEEMIKNAPVSAEASDTK
ncbi:hypothetical protein H0X06_01315 [Candidatus Dependentiae bacterium]|nr:hypothetical protein [Candidatus Dependentiae bacterium]